MAIFSKKAGSETAEMSFLDHLESLRWHIVRSVIAVTILSVAAFFFNEFIFGQVLFGPKKPDFLTYRLLCKFSHWAGMGDKICIVPPEFSLINTEMSGQFTMHMWVAFVAGLIIASPYVLWELWRFVKPALRPREKKNAGLFIFVASFLFITGVVFSYYVLTPLTVSFLGGYEVSGKDVLNMPTLDSYISLVTTLTLLTGLVFELPILVYFLSRFGIVTPQFMRKYRKHAVVVILVVAAVITPSSDIFSQVAVALPIYALYEISILVSAYVVRKNAQRV